MLLIRALRFRFLGADASCIVKDPLRLNAPHGQDLGPHHRRHRCMRPSADASLQGFSVTRPAICVSSIPMSATINSTLTMGLWDPTGPIREWLVDVHGGLAGEARYA